MSAQEALTAAREREARREAATVPTNYNALNRMVKRQRAALTRAVNAGDVDKLVLVVQAAVRDWNAPGVHWPDDWSRWQRALDDALPFHEHVDIADLA